MLHVAPTCPPWFHHPNNIGWREQIMKPHICNCFNPSAISFALSPNITFSTLFSNSHLKNPSSIKIPFLTHTILVIKQWWVVSPPYLPKAERPPLVCCPWLLSQHICSYPPPTTNCGAKAEVAPYVLTCCHYKRCNILWWYGVAIQEDDPQHVVGNTDGDGTSPSAPSIGQPKSVSLPRSHCERGQGGVRCFWTA